MPALVRALLLCCLLLSGLPHAAASPHAAEPTLPTLDAKTLVPLPKGCGDGLPPGAEIPVCCLFGYVIMDGQPVDGAAVVIRNPATGAQIETWSARGPDSDQAYFRLDLSGAPLRLEVGDAVTLTATYSSRSVTISHQVLNGGQQLDLVIPSEAAAADHDYVLERQIYAQAPLGQFNMHRAALTIDGSDTVYVTDWSNARVQAFNLSGQSLLAWGTLGDANGSFISPSGVAADGLGNVYVTDYGAHTLSKFTRAGEFLARWGSVGSAPDQLLWPADVVVGPDGNLYVADSGNHRVQVFAPTGAALRRFGTEGDGPDQLREPSGLSFGPDGNLYVADSGNQRVQVFSSEGLSLRRWSLAGQLETPDKLSFSPQGTLYVADRTGNRVLHFDTQGALLGQIGAGGVEAGQFNGVGGLAFSSDGRLFVADSYNGRVQIFSAGGTLVGQWGQRGAATGRVFDAAGIALNAAGQLYATDASLSLVKQYDAEGQFVRSFGGWGSAPGELIWPAGLEVASTGDVYIADAGNHRIQQFTAEGTFVRTWGTFGNLNGQFSEPNDVAIGPGGTVYVADTGNHRVQQFTSEGVFVRAWGEQGSASGQFNRPLSLAVGPNGDLHVAEAYNRVQQFTATGTFVRSWGSFGYAPGQLAELSGITVGADGSVYVTEFGGYRFQRFTTEGVLLQTYGRSGASPGGINQPVAIAVTAGGSVYVAERNLGRIQRFRPTSYTRPIATIVAATPRVVVAGQAITLHGRGSASSVTAGVLSYEWRLADSVQSFATTATASLATSGFSPGEYVVSLQVRDSSGARSEPRQITITVAQNTPDTLPASWTFLLYLAGDNNQIAAYLDDSSELGALYRLRMRAGGPNVNVVALFDGDRPGGGDSFRYLMRPGEPVQIEALGEVNMGDPQTLSEFIEWGRQQAPADAYYLAIANHGNALDGIAWDYTSDPLRNERLSPPELRQALVAATGGGARPLDIIHFDACLMGLIESAYQIRGLARYAIVSENLAWSSFGYADYRDLVGARTAPRSLASAIAANYASRIARDQLPFTISVLDMARIDQTALTADALAGELLRYTLGGVEQRQRLQAVRTQAQKLDSSGNGTITTNDAYVDLDHFAELLIDQLADAPTVQAATRLRTALSEFVIYNRAQSGRLSNLLTGASEQVELTNARGLAIYYPPWPSQDISTTYRRQFSFAADTRWDEWLLAQLTALGPSLDAAAPNPVAPHILPPQRIFLPLVRR